MKAGKNQNHPQEPGFSMYGDTDVHEMKMLYCGRVSEADKHTVLASQGGAVLS